MKGFSYSFHGRVPLSQASWRDPLFFLTAETTCQNELRPGDPGRLPAPGSHRPVRAHISAYGSSEHSFATCDILRTARRHVLGARETTCFASVAIRSCFVDTSPGFRCIRRMSQERFHTPASRFPPRGPARCRFPRFDGTIRMLRLPAFHSAALRFLRLAVPRPHLRFVPS